MPKVANTTATAAASAVEMPVPATVSITVDDAEQLYELFKGIEAADSHFHTCQSVNFRDHIKAVYKARKVSAAFEGLKQQIDKAKEV